MFANNQLRMSNIFNKNQKYLFALLWQLVERNLRPRIHLNSIPSFQTHVPRHHQSLLNTSECQNQYLCCTCHRFYLHGRRETHSQHLDSVHLLCSIQKLNMHFKTFHQICPISTFSLASIWTVPPISVQMDPFIIVLCWTPGKAISRTNCCAQIIVKSDLFKRERKDTVSIGMISSYCVASRS